MPETDKESRVLTTLDIDMIAERAARRALDLVLVEVGRSVVKKTLFIVGVVFVFALVMLKTGKPL
jgi:hypothetical protein|tara:strand:- start:4706 stop:4900 length:195 start_codon:yes stop_codon:yes gene_type:complete